MVSIKSRSRAPGCSLFLDRALMLSNYTPARSSSFRLPSILRFVSGSSILSSFLPCSCPDQHLTPFVRPSSSPHLPISLCQHSKEFLKFLPRSRRRRPAPQLLALESTGVKINHKDTKDTKSRKILCALCALCGSIHLFENFQFEEEHLKR